MKQVTKMSRATALLEKMFRAINEEFFDGELDTPVITIQSSRKSYGHVSVAKVWQSGNERKHELNISAEWLTRPLENVVATMVHEATHLYCSQHEIKDTSRGGIYHNGRFRQEAEARGLLIDYDPRIGWSVTTPGQRLLDFIAEQDWGEFEICRANLIGLAPISGTGSHSSGGMPTTTRKPSSTRKFSCPGCGLKVRITKQGSINLMCCDCSELLLERLK